MSDFFSQLSSFSINELFLFVAEGDNPIFSGQNSILYNVDIKPIMERIDIYENIIAPIIYGSITVTDTMGLSKLLSTGSCYIKMNISKVSRQESSQVSSYEKIFRIYKQSQRKKRSENSEVYTFYFCSDEYVLSQQSFVNKGYSDTYSNMAKNILQEYLSVSDNEIILSNSFGIKNVTIPSLRPLDALQWCASRAVNSNFIPDFLSFENRDGYNFVSLSDLFSNEAIPINFNIKNANTDDEEDANKYFSVNDSTITSQFNLLDSIKKGSFAGTIYGYDIVTRTFFKQQINSSYYDNRMIRLNDSNGTKLIPSVKNKKGILSSEASDSKRTVIVTDSQFRQSKYAISKVPAIKLHEPEQSLAHRSAVFSFLSNKKMKIILPGNLNLTVGMLVELKYPKRGLKNSEKIDDDTFSGKCLIIAVRHVFMPDKHETLLEISSDSDVIST